jgi:hypothetical protein
MSNYGAYNRASAKPAPALSSVVEIKTRSSTIKRPVKKMNIIKRLFIRAVAWAHEHRHADRDGEQPKPMLDSASHTPDTHPLRLQIWYAQGGIAIETASYDRRSDENRRQFFIIPETANLPEELDRILTLANLSRA